MDRIKGFLYNMFLGAGVIILVLLFWNVVVK